MMMMTVVGHFKNEAYVRNLAQICYFGLQCLSFVLDVEWRSVLEKKTFLKIQDGTDLHLFQVILQLIVQGYS